MYEIVGRIPVVACLKSSLESVHSVPKSPDLQ